MTLRRTQRAKRLGLVVKKKRTENTRKTGLGDQQHAPNCKRFNHVGQEPKFPRNKSTFLAGFHAISR